MESQATDKSPIKEKELDQHQQSTPQQFDYSPEEIQILRKALAQNNLFSLSLYFVDYILRAQTSLFEQIYSEQGKGENYQFYGYLMWSVIWHLWDNNGFRA